MSRGGLTAEQRKVLQMIADSELGSVIWREFAGGQGARALCEPMIRRGLIRESRRMPGHFTVTITEAGRLALSDQENAP